MRRRTIGSGASALLLLATVASAHKSVHDRLEILHKRHQESRIAQRSNETGEEEIILNLKKRGGKCQFPWDAGLVPITPGSLNAGWAMSPDEPCEPGKYCPYACPAGQVMMQWDPKATSYSYPQSMNGGLYCDQDGQVSKPFPDKPYCKQTSTNIGVVNNAGGTVAFCQTVLPGNEAMLIPTSVDGYATLAVPGTDYWAGTAAHYYINPPGTSASQACVWGTNANPYGNWSPYVAGTNVDLSGQTFIKLGWNPIYLEPTTPFRTKMPDWGVKIDCPNGGCSGLPCAIDPNTNKVNDMKGGASTGAGGGNFCVVTVSKGATANFVVYGGSGTDKGGQFYQHSSAAASLSSSATATADASTATAVASSSTTKSKTSTEQSSSESSSSEDSSSRNSTSTMTASSTTTKMGESSWSMSNTTSSSRSGPTGPHYYDLFNTSVPSPNVAAATEAVETAATATKARMPSSTGGAARLPISMAALTLPIALWSLLL